ncbi:DNA-directed RNA polymerase II subunit [Rhizina undulata]
MFFIHELQRTVTLHPSYLGPNIHDYIIHKLHADVEGSCTGRYFIICVIEIENITLGRVIPGKGDTEYLITYKAVVWRPFKGETVDGVVSSVNKIGFFAEVGPLTVFVSIHMIPSDIKFDATANPPQFTDNADQIITKGSHIRIKIIGIRSDVGKMNAIGSIKEASLPSAITMQSLVSNKYILIEGRPVYRTISGMNMKTCLITKTGQRRLMQIHRVL